MTDMTEEGHQSNSVISLSVHDARARGGLRNAVWVTFQPFLRKLSVTFTTNRERCGILLTPVDFTSTRFADKTARWAAVSLTCMVVHASAFADRRSDVRLVVQRTNGISLLLAVSSECTSRRIGLGDGGTVMFTLHVGSECLTTVRNWPGRRGRRNVVLAWGLESLVQERWRCSLARLDDRVHRRRLRGAHPAPPLTPLTPS